MNVAERWACVEPGIVLDELNATLRPHGLRFAPDISTASRATVGGMIANNSSGARSVMYGKTIDHVIEQHVVLADGSTAHFRPLDAAALEQACRAAERSKRRATERSASCAVSCRDEIDRRFPKVLRRVGGYNLDEFVDPAKPFNLAKIIVGIEGTLALVVAARVKLVPLPAAKAVLTIEFRSAPRRARRHAVDSPAHAVGGRGDGQVHPRPREGKPRARRAAAEHPRTPILARCSASSSTTTAPSCCRRGSTRSSASCRGRHCAAAAAAR